MPVIDFYRWTRPPFPWVITLYRTDEKLLFKASLAGIYYNVTFAITSRPTLKLPETCEKLPYVKEPHYAPSHRCRNVLIHFFVSIDEPNQLESDHLEGYEGHWSIGNEQNVFQFHRNEESLGSSSAMLGPSILQFINQTLTRSDPEGAGMSATTVENIKRAAMKCSFWIEGIFNESNKGLSFN